MNISTSSNEIEQKAYEFAIKIVITAGKHILKYWHNPTNTFFDESHTMDIFEKTQGTGNYATTADKESEAIIINAIQENPLFKNHNIIAEESDKITAESKYQWLIDPIDGTPPFNNGLPEFGISIGLLNGKDPVIGAIAMPALGQLIAARKGQGAKLLSFDGKLLKDLSTSDNIPQLSMDKVLVAYDLGYVGRGRQLSQIVSKIADKVGYPVCYGSCSAANFRMSQGLVGAYFFETPKEFDIAAAAAIIPETGGVVTDMKGNSIDWSSDSRTYLAAVNPQIHSQLLEIINS